MSGYSVEEQKRTRRWLKDHRICTRCQARMAFGRYTKCPECLEKTAQADADYRARHPERKRESARKSYEKHKAEGRCTQCGRPAEEGKTMCKACLLKMRERRLQNYVSKAKPYGICRYCDQPVAEGKKLCKAHCEVYTAHLRTGTRQDERHPWILDEKVRRIQCRERTRK